MGGVVFINFFKIFSLVIVQSAQIFRHRRSVMFYLKEHTCNICGHRWHNNLDISTCPRMLEHTQIMRERILGASASSPSNEKANDVPLAAKPPAEK